MGKSQVLICAIDHAIQNEMSVLVAAPVAFLAQSHGGARPPPVCADRAWVDFFKMAPKKSAKAYGFRHIGF